MPTCPIPPALAHLAGGMAHRLRDFAWERSPLGAMDAWPQPLVSAVATVLECQLPMCLIWGLDGPPICNDACRSVLGPQASTLGAPPHELWRQLWPTLLPMAQQAWRGEPVGGQDLPLSVDRHGFPEQICVCVSVSAVRDAQGAAAGVLIALSETTARVQAERRLAFLEQLVERTRTLETPQDVMRTTAALLGQHLSVSRCAYALVRGDEDSFDLIGDYNREVESIVGSYRFSDFGPEVLRLMRADQAYVNRDVDADARTAGTDLTAYRRTAIRAVVCVPLHKQGRFVAAMAVHQNQPRHWTDDEVALVRTVVARCWDVLERTRTEAALRDEARTLETLNRTGAALAATLDLEALLQDVTDAATELTGAQFGAFFYNGVHDNGEAYVLYTLSGADRHAFGSLGHPRPTALLGPTFRGEATVRLDDVTADPRYGRFAPHFGKPSGHLPVRSYLAVPVTSRAGEVLGGLFFGHADVAVFSDRSQRIAEGIASQAAIAIDNARLYAALRDAMSERTRLLDSERSARQAAEKAGLLKDEFLTTLSHELRTPLSAIAGWAHLLRRKFGSTHTELSKGIDVISRSAKAQSQLIEDLLDMSRVTSGQLTVEFAPVDLAEGVRAAVELLLPAAERAGLQIRCDVAASGPVTTSGDAGRLQQVVSNLVSNAIKFTPRGGEVQVTLQAAGSRAQIVVTDNGIGIAPDFLPHVFDRFRQADGSIARRHGGLGLGLAIVRHLVELHGGRVHATSAGKGLGASFTVELPLIDATALPANSEAVLDVNDRSLLAGQRVLLVDDDLAVRDVVGRALQMHGAEVLMAGSGDEALRVLPASGATVLVSDLGMPGMTGYELLTQVRAQPAEHGGNIRAIALTAFKHDADRSRALAAGFESHMAKPINFAELIHAIGRRPDGPAGTGLDEGSAAAA